MTPTALDIAADCEAIGHAVEHGYIAPITVGNYQNEKLVSALDDCVAARSLIEVEQSKIQALIDAAEDDTVYQARLYQRDLIAWQLERAATLAEERKQHIESLTDLEAEDARCSVDIHYWSRYYAWGFDPRPDAPLAVVPLGSFDFQAAFIDWLDDLVFVRRSSGTADKSRDMGATVTALRWGLHRWLYRKHFTLLLASAKEELTDKIGDSDTLFERLRFLLRMLPEWMLPRGFDLLRDLPYMKLANPENGSLITGSAPTTSLGEGRRRSCAIGDEFADWPEGGYPQYRTLTQTTKSFIAISTPKGKLNKYSDLVHDGVTPGFTMDWREHPWKDDRWYNSLKFGILCPAMTEEDIAQEIDRNYDASQPGRVLRNVKEEYVFITQDEFVNGFGETRRHHFFTADGRFKLPDDFTWGRVGDYGESARHEDDTHIWAYSLFARPAERWPLSDSLFFFISRPIEPIGATELQAFACYSQWERDLGLRNSAGFIRRPSVNDMSHEALDAKNVLLTKCGDFWAIPDLDFDKGRRKLVFHFEITDKHKVNPFRPGLPDCAPMMGRARIYFVCLNNEYQLAYNERNKQYFVTPSETQVGFKRLRAEISSWHYPPEERGKPVPKMRPKALFDDIVTTVRYAVARWGMEAVKLTESEQVRAEIPERYRYETVAAQGPLTPEKEMSMAFQEAQAKRRVEARREIVTFDEFGHRVGGQSDADED